MAIPEKEQIKEELISVIKKADESTVSKLEDRDSFLIKCCAISEFLAGGPDKVAKSLKKLENALLVKVGSETKKNDAKSYFGNWKARQSNKSVKGEYSKLLTQVLTQTEKGAGFNVLADGSVKIYLGFLSNEVFAKQATIASHWKDLVATDHGEYTHRIQWYLVCEGDLKEFSNKTEFAESFIFINSIPNLWDYIFDRVRQGDPPRRHGELDFRGPEALNSYLCSVEAAKSYPLLSSFLSHRKDKRIFQFDDNKNVDAKKDYVAKKLYSKSYIELNEGSKGKQVVDDIMKDGLFETGPTNQGKLEK